MQIHRTVILSFALSAVAVAASAQQTQPAARHGDHPAVVAKRLQSTAGYDYASKFYPHPAGYALRLEEPREMGEHPAVLAWRRDREQRLQLLADLQDAVRDERATAHR